jgi:hypothetical protein
MRPPRVALRLVEQFAAPDQREAILGDLHEEFSAVANHIGIRSARHWFWRQIARTLVHLIVAAFRQNPTTLGLSVTAGFLVWWNVPMVIEEVVRRIHYRWHAYHHIDAYSFWLLYAVLLQNALVPLLVGSLLGASNRGRENVASAGLALTILAWTGGALLLTPNPNYRHLWIEEALRALLTGLSLFIGGAIVRKVRYTPLIQRSGA